MARPEPSRNAYEEFPDDLKELLNKRKGEKGQKPDLSTSREALLQDHERHLRFLAEGVLQPRNFILPTSYPPSRISRSQSKYISLTDLRIDTRNPSNLILLRTIAEPYVYSASITIVEDQNGNIARLTLYNLEDSLSDPVVPKGSLLCVKQPCWSKGTDGGYHIRVVHPSDLAFLNADDEVLPTAWKRTSAVENPRTTAEWKREGDLMFLKKRFRKALELYECGRQLLKSSDTAARIDMYRKRCNVNIILLRFDDAAGDLAQAISLHHHMFTDPETSKIIDSFTVEAWLHNQTTDDPLHITSNLPRPLKDLAVRIKFDLGIYQNDPVYDLASISSYVGPLTLHVDAPSYISDTEIKQTLNHGRGLFAKRNFQAGNLIMAEKAFALPVYLFNDSSSECSLYSLGDGTATDRAGALLFKELVQKLQANPRMCKSFFELDDGGYWAENGWEVANGEKIPVDVFRVEHIRRRNCFAAPLRAIDVLTTPTPVRNGFWIHTSYINHACLPNSVRTFLGDMLLLRATRDIYAGEEITAEYVTPELTFKDRQQKYKDTWGFECDCSLCVADREAGPEVEKQRMALFEELKGTAQKLGKQPTATALKKFAKRLKVLEALYDGRIYAELPKLCLVHPTLFLTEAWRVFKNTDRTIESATKLLMYFGIDTKVEGSRLEVVKNSGLVNVECVRALKYLAEGYTAKSQVELASSILETAKVWFRIITGADVGSQQFLQS